MSNFNSTPRLLGRVSTGVFALALVALGACAQNTTLTTVQHGAASFDTLVKNARVVYVEGNDLVLKLENGKIEHMIVPASEKFTIDGRDLTVSELTPGTTLTQTVTTTSVPRYITTVQTLEGTVWHVNAHTYTVILRLPNGDTHSYTIPRNATFNINGKKANVHDLRKGMNIKATIATDDVHNVMEQTKATVGQAPPPSLLSREMGVLLFFEPPVSPAPPVASAGPEQFATSLPKTGSFMPLAGLLGAFATAMSLGVGVVRRAFAKA